jgi:iron complex outermembrane recepter protein
MICRTITENEFDTIGGCGSKGDFVKLRTRLPACGTGALALLGTVGSPAFAADDDKPLQEIVVTGVRQAMRDSIEAKRITDLVSDNISTADIGQLPDVTIAEELNRLPGVNTTRDRGNASQAAIRGLGPRMVFGLVNGREVASSEPSQDLRWEIYPSEILSGAQVYKTQDAALVAGGIAATVDIRTLSPLDYHGPTFSLRAGPTYNEGGKDLPHYDPKGYRGSAGYVDHVNDDFAFSLAASVQREKNGFPDFRTFGWNTDDNSGGNTGDLNGDGIPDNTTWGLVTEVKEVTQDRYALAGSAGWRAGDDLTIKADALWSQYEIQEDQFQAWYGNNVTGNWQNGNAGLYNAPGNSYQIVDGTVVAADLNGAFPNYESSINQYKERHTLAMTGLNAAWKGEKWSTAADLSYSEAWRRNRWEAIYLTDVFPPNLAFDVTSGSTPFGATPGFNPADPAIQSAGGFRANSGSNVNGTGQSDGPEETRDKLGAFTLDFTRGFETPFFNELKFGARAADREKTHSRSRYGLCAGTGSTVFATPFDTNSQQCRAGSGIVDLSNAGLESFNVPGFTAPPMVYGNFDAVRKLVYPDDSVPEGSDQLLVRTKVKENSWEGYARLGFSTQFGDMPLTGGIGFRVAHMDTKSSGFQTTDNVTFTPVSVKNDYTDFLPSLNATLHLTDEHLLRFGAAVAISRPPLDALVTGFTLNNTGTPPTGGGGNPLLRPYKAKQVDLSYEWYFHDESLFAVAVYYKDLDNIIGASQSLQTIDGVQYIITSENNVKGGPVRGAEVSYQTRFHFLPGFLQNFGIYANYAYVDSNVREVAPVSDPYTMVGLAKNTSELDLFYNKGGFESRIAWKHHSEFTVAPTWVGTTLKQLAPEDILDASVSYNWNTQWSVRLQGHNLTNERGLFLSDNLTQNLSNDGGYQVYGRSYLLDVAVRF